MIRSFSSPLQLFVVPMGPPRPAARLGRARRTRLPRYLPQTPTRIPAGIFGGTRQSASCHRGHGYPRTAICVPVLVRHALAKYTTPGKTYGDVLLELIEEYPTEAYLQEMDGGTGRSPHLAERTPTRKAY